MDWVLIQRHREAAVEWQNAWLARFFDSEVRRGLVGPTGRSEKERDDALNEAIAKCRAIEEEMRNA